MNHYCEVQSERINLNKSVQFYNDDLEELKNILIAVDELFKVDTETFARDFSVRVFKDSKIFERIASKVVSLIYEFGNFAEKDRSIRELKYNKESYLCKF